MLWAGAALVVAFGMAKTMEGISQGNKQRNDRYAARAVSMGYFQVEADMKYLKHKRALEKMEADLMVRC